MSKTPVFDFVKKYAESDVSRLHMPGHKGRGLLGCEEYDITEIHGADSLFEADGIIAESEKNLSEIFGSRASFYSTEGSSLCIRTMVFLAMQFSGGKKKILAGRNAHKSFMSALGLCDAEVDWLFGEDLYSCKVSPEELDRALSNGEYFAVYVTCPDYLGNVIHLPSIADVCHKHNVPLLVDNAHGAYLKFTGQHPMDNGADMCCDSAHKTLPCLTGSAYLHVSDSALFPYEKSVKKAMSLFASTSPSYLIMASMDKANEIMLSGYGEKVRHTSFLVDELKTNLSHFGFEFTGHEKLKINIKPKSKGYLGTELASILEEEGIHPEFCDKDNLVLMFSTQNDERDFDRIKEVLSTLEDRPSLSESAPKTPRPKKILSVRNAVFAPSEKVKTCDAVGRILASPCVSCPPAIPIVVCGEMIDECAVECFGYYGVEEVDVVKQNSVLLS